MVDAVGGAVPARNVDAGRGMAWWTEAWALFMKSAALWVVLSLLLLVVFVVLALIPALGTVATSLLLPVFVASWMLAARKVEAGGELAPGDLFVAFNDKLVPLLVLGAVLLAATLAIFVVVGALGFGAVVGLMAGGGQASAGGMMAALGAGFVALLAGLLLSVVVAMAFWFAPALVVLRNVPPVDAMKASFAANLKNIGAFLIYGAIYLVAAIVASVPAGLGWLVLAPLSLLTIYVSYRDLFEPPLLPPPQTAIVL